MVKLLTSTWFSSPNAACPAQAGGTRSCGGQASTSGNRREILKQSDNYKGQFVMLAKPHRLCLEWMVYVGRFITKADSQRTDWTDTAKPSAALTTPRTKKKTEIAGISRFQARKRTPGKFPRMNHNFQRIVRGANGEQYGVNTLPQEPPVFKSEPVGPTAMETSATQAMDPYSKDCFVALRLKYMHGRFDLASKWTFTKALFLLSRYSAAVDVPSLVYFIFVIRTHLLSGQSRKILAVFVTIVADSISASVVVFSIQPKCNIGTLKYVAIPFNLVLFTNTCVVLHTVWIGVTQYRHNLLILILYRDGVMYFAFFVRRVHKSVCL
ncbi:hypothetical protein B0H13DRAFT_1875775 [Mycena leptocephala]|nr:hypothetical protein B0H13DRAFT_1875775 [Mycena leptocephala]